MLYHGHSIWDKVKNIKTEDEDVHAKLMRNYPEVPDWWYWAYFLLVTTFSIMVIEVRARLSFACTALSSEAEAAYLFLDLSHRVTSVGTYISVISSLGICVTGWIHLRDDESANFSQSGC